MKSFFALLFFISTGVLVGQKISAFDSIRPGKGSREQQIVKIDKEKVKLLSDTTGDEPRKNARIDSTVLNKYGNLLNDDTCYHKKFRMWKPGVEVFGINAAIWGFDRFASKAEYAKINLSSWKYNIKQGWEWDQDRFEINFIGHPYSGTLYYNAARSLNYNFYQSSLFAAGGSLMWEYFGENTLPSYNDIICTPINGIFLGEILYRLSSNILDDRTRGLERVTREILAGIINPIRGLNRVLQGKSFRTTNKEIYQKEPLNISLYTGFHKINDGQDIVLSRGRNSILLNVQFDYGNPFENRKRKPFDFFKLRTDFSFGEGRKFLNNASGYGILAGKNISYKKRSLLFGVFQYSDYWNNKTFELGAIGFGAGVFSKLNLPRKSELYSNAHIGLIPFAGNSTKFGPDTTHIRDYDFGKGLEGKFESTINVGRFATASLIYYFYIIRAYVGQPGDNFISIIKPRVTVRLYKGVSLGFEHFMYYNDRYLKDSPAIHSVRTEQKLFLLIYFEDKQRRGHYN